MQQLSHFATTAGAQAPVFVAVLFDAATNLPKFALIHENPTDMPLLNMDGVLIETRGLLQDCTVSVQRPTDGGGIIRRSCNLTIQTEHERGYAFFKSSLSKSMYYGGQGVQDVYFGLYAFDRQYMFSDLRSAMFLGMYQIEAGVEWTEEAGATSIPLTEMIVNDTTIVGATEEEIPEELFLFNPWFTGQAIPKVFGQVPRIKLLNSFPTISVKDIAGSISGLVQANYTNVSGTIILESNTDQSSTLRQLAASGGYVRIKMANGEVIKGTLVYNSITNQVSMTVVTRNTYYAQTQGYTHTANGETPKDWGYNALDGLQKHPSVWSTNASVLLNGKKVVQDSEGYMQASVVFYENSTTFVTETAAAKMTGWQDEDKGVINHEVFYDATHTYTTLLSYKFLLGGFLPVNYRPGDPMPGYQFAYEQYLYFNGSNVTLSLFFADPAATVTGGSIGDEWSLVGYEPASISYECYIRNGFSRFLGSHVYAEGNGRLIRIPDANVVSVTDSTTVMGLSNMAKIVLTMAPIDMNIGATSNIVYTDALYRTSTNENRTERVLYEILKESPELVQFAGDNITGTGDGYATDNWLPYIGYVARGDENVSDILDRICFQCGATFKWSRNKFWLRSAAHPSGMLEDVVIDGDTYVHPTATTTDQTEMLESTARLGFGKMQTQVDDDGYEFIPLYLEVQYGGWEDPFYKPAKPIINRAIKPSERRISVNFDLINDSSSAKYAVGLFLSIGHPSAVSSVQRTINTDMLMHGCRWEAMDPIVFKDFPLLTTADETNATLDAWRNPHYLKPSDAKRFLMGALGVVDSVEYQFSVQNPKVALTARMSQTFTEASGAGIYNPPYPPGAPNPPSNDPSNPPSTGGGGNGTVGGGGGFTSGGDLDPMGLSVSGDTSVEIDSTTAKTCEVLVTVDDSSGSRGPSWSVEVEDDYGTGGVSLDVSGGTFADKLNDSYVPDVITITVTVSYAWMFPFPHSVNRPLTLKFTYNTPSLDGGDTLEEYAYHTIDVTLKDLIDIEES